MRCFVDVDFFGRVTLAHVVNVGVLQNEAGLGNFGEPTEVDERSAEDGDESEEA